MQEVQEQAGTGLGLRYVCTLPWQTAVAFPLLCGIARAFSVTLVFPTRASYCGDLKSLSLSWHPKIFPGLSLGKKSEQSHWKFTCDKKKKKNKKLKKKKELLSQMQAGFSFLKKETAKSLALPYPPPPKQVVCQTAVRSNGWTWFRGIKTMLKQTKSRLFPVHTWLILAWDQAAWALQIREALCVSL